MHSYFLHHFSNTPLSRQHRLLLKTAHLRHPWGVAIYLFYDYVRLMSNFQVNLSSGFILWEI